MSLPIFSDWCGNARREQGLCPSGPSATRTVHVVPGGTLAVVKRVGDKRWVPHTVKEDYEALRPYRELDDAFVYFQGGWLLCVKKRFVQVKVEDGSVRFDRARTIRPPQVAKG